MGTADAACYSAGMNLLLASCRAIRENAYAVAAAARRVALDKAIEVAKEVYAAAIEAATATAATGTSDTPESCSAVAHASINAQYFARYASIAADAVHAASIKDADIAFHLCCQVKA
jgi:hypothetical protein